MVNKFRQGMRDGFPICLGYLSVSFGFGILAVRSGLPWWAAVLISITNVTSAGQVAGVGVIAHAGPLIEMALTQLVINCRYSLMALSLSQNLSEDFTTPRRLLVSYGITDEIFGVAASKKEPVTPVYMYGMSGVSVFGWTLGTLLGAVCGDVLPQLITSALGILLYGMFIAIIIPPVRESRANLAVILLAAAISCAIFYLIPRISSGFSIIISAVIAAGVLAAAAPVPETEEEGAA